jgi:hypothetical protein
MGLIFRHILLEMCCELGGAIVSYCELRVHIATANVNIV